jgi:hypothetical protein
LRYTISAVRRSCDGSDGDGDDASHQSCGTGSNARIDDVQQHPAARRPHHALIDVKGVPDQVNCNRQLSDSG